MNLPVPVYGDVPGTPQQLEVALKARSDNYDIDALTQHGFAPGLYVRQLTLPQGAVIVGKMHKSHNVFFLARGELSIWDGVDTVRVSAPFAARVAPGDKRVGYAHTECVTFNIHANPDNETDLETLEARYTVAEIEHGPALAIEDQTT